MLVNISIQGIVESKERNKGKKQINRSRDDIMSHLSVLPIQILPDKVQSVDLPVMQVEDRLQRRPIEVTTRIATFEFNTC
jgi:hypothetical protein